jgi:60 kDa SS-A/Ro ribonucleoprotein
MANNLLFPSLPAGAQAANATNEAGGKAYAFAPKHALAQYAVTGCLNGTYYAGAATQLERTLELVCTVDPAFAAKVAVYSREKGFMKDMPALLCAALSVLDATQLKAAFPRACDDGKTVRNFVQILRSGAVGRKSLGSVPKKLVQRWLESRTDEQLFRATVGQSPSLADVVKMVHPRPSTPTRAALYAWMIGRPHDAEALPECVKAFEAFKRGESREVPDVPFQMLTASPLGKDGWTAIARQASWTTTRMNLNTFARHGVFEDPKVTRLIANRLRDPALVRKARVFPYQLLVAHTQADAGVPEEVREALHDAMEVAIQNVPSVQGRLVVCPDVSGSMQSAVTGVRQGSTTVVTCRDVAAPRGCRFAPQESEHPDSAVRRRCRARPFGWPRLGDDERPPDGVAAAGRNRLQRAAAILERDERVRRPRGVRLGQHELARLPRWGTQHGIHDRMGDFSPQEPECPTRVSGHPACGFDPGSGTRGYPEHRRVLGLGF